MEHEQLTKHEPSSSTTVVEDAEEPTSSRYWTSVEYASDSDDEGYVRVLPGRDVQKYDMGEFTLLEKIGEGGQGTTYSAQLSSDEKRSTSPGRGYDHAVAVKVFRGRSGQWPGEVFGLHSFNPHICKFFGYCLEGESFYLVMAKYDCSLRDLLDLLMAQNECEGRPLPDIVALHTIIEIALGMSFLHENNIIHRDLKADNVFVIKKDLLSDVPPLACIGDFDIASKVVGTLFWRAPEVLLALKEGKRPVFTPQADVYSFAMTCYEILTGGVPLEGVRASDYDAVLLHGKRPKLPSNLNPIMKGFMSRCWHQDPEARPTFKEIVVELKELHRELITGSELVSKWFDRTFSNESNGSSSLNFVKDSPEICLLELRVLLQALLVKYGKEDFLLLGLEIVADLERYQAEFGLRSFKEHPILPMREYFARHRHQDRFRWKLKVFGRLTPNIIESNTISQLLAIITLAVKENYSSNGYTTVQSGSAEMLNISDWEAWKEECEARVLPEARHAVCVESPQQGCDLCKFGFVELMKDLDLKEEDIRFDFKSCLYVEEDLASLVSSRTESIGALSSPEKVTEQCS